MAKTLAYYGTKLMRLCTPQMAVPVPSISCCVLNHHNLFYQIQNALAFNRDTFCHLALCLWLLPFHYCRKMFYSAALGCLGVALLSFEYFKTRTGVGHFNKVMLREGRKAGRYYDIRRNNTQLNVTQSKKHEAE